MPGFVELLSGVIRLGPDCHKYGDPFVKSAAWSSIDGKTAILKGVHGEVTHQDRREVVRLMKELGLKVDRERVRRKKCRVHRKRNTVSWP